jgi:light-regulated signal transduction histidine kinase (bacteriophytochrome)
MKENVSDDMAGSGPDEAELHRLRQENEQLRAKLADFETTLKQAELVSQQSLESVSAANKALDEFVYTVSHDLQAPLRTIGSYVQLLERRVPAEPEPAEYMGFIVKGVSRLEALIRDLLEYSRIGTSMRPASLNLGSGVQWALFKLDASLREHNAVVQFSNLPEVIADESRMSQLFQHLIDNALKYRSELAPVIIISAEELDNDWTISVQDNGIGIEAKYQNQIFQVFKRLHGESIPGTGMGLAISRKIVESHGGRLLVESDGKTGSDFRFTLPK